MFFHDYGRKGTSPACPFSSSRCLVRSTPADDDATPETSDQKAETKKDGEAYKVVLTLG